ncbi:MAG: hypothetical protein ABSH53_22605 [Holophaga sp.]|jgi:hypothetical protein
MSVRVPSGEIRRICHKGTSGWDCRWELDVSTAGRQVILELTTDEEDREPVLQVELRLDREEAGRVLDLFLAAMVEAGHQD